MKKVVLCGLLFIGLNVSVCYGMSSYAYLRPFQYSFVKALEKNNLYQIRKCLNKCPALLIDCFYDENQIWFTALQLAAKMGRREVVDLLIRRGALASIDIKHNYGQRTSYWVPKLLMRKGAADFVNVKNGQGKTALHSVMQVISNPRDEEEYNDEINNRIAIINCLIGVGAGINALDIYGKSPLHDAAYCGCPELVLSLLEYPRTDGSLNARDKNGWTPLFTAVAGKHTKVALAILKSGADATIPTNDNITPLQKAQYGLDIELMVELKRAVSSQVQPSAVSSSSSSQDVQIEH